MAFNPNKCLKFESLEDGCVISLSASPIDSSHYQFSKNGTDWVDDTITLDSGETCYVKGTNYPSRWGGYGTFSISKKAKIVSGNVMSLIDDGAGESMTLTAYCFAFLFKNCVNLQAVPSGFLPATTFAKNCYRCAFENCVGLKIIPVNFLPSTTPAYGCYDMMFNHCTGLKEVHVSFTSWGTDDSTSGWFMYCSKPGDFHCPRELPIKYDESYIYPGWRVVYPDNAFSVNFLKKYKIGGRVK